MNVEKISIHIGEMDFSRKFVNSENWNAMPKWNILKTWKNNSRERETNLTLLKNVNTFAEY